MAEERVSKGGVLIKSAGDKMIDISVLKGRDVEFLLRDSNVDPRVKQLLYQLAEGHNETRNVLKQTVSLLEEMIDVVSATGLAIEGAHKKLEMMQKESLVNAEQVDPDITTN